MLVRERIDVLTRNPVCGRDAVTEAWGRWRCWWAVSLPGELVDLWAPRTRGGRSAPPGDDHAYARPRPRWYAH